MGDKLFRQINGSLFYIGETSEQIMPRGEEESYRNAFSGNLNTKSENFPHLVGYSREDKALTIL